MTATRTASQRITDEVTSWSGVQAGPGRRGVGPAARRIQGDEDVHDVSTLMRLNYDAAHARQTENGGRQANGSRAHFSPAELAYLTSQRRLARLATVGPNGTPHVVPVGFTYNPELETIDVTGRDLPSTKKYRDVQRTGRAAIVVDDLASTDPWHPRAVEVRGRAEAIAGSRPLIRIHATRIVSWGLEAAS